MFWHKLEIYYYFLCGNTKNWFLDNIFYFKFYSIWYLIFYHLKCGLVIDYLFFILIRRGCLSNKTRKEIQLSFKENFITQPRPDSIKDVGDLATKGTNCLLARNSLFSITVLCQELLRMLWPGTSTLQHSFDWKKNTILLTIKKEILLTFTYLK